MDSVRDAVIRCLRDYAEDGTRFLHSLNMLAQQEGEIVFPTLLHILTHLDFSVQDARDNWEQILYHQKKMSHQLNRPVSLTTATCDFFSSVQRSFKNPKVVEVETFEKAERSSKIDGLTGLYNRRYFDEALDAETKRAKRYRQNFSLAMFDLDHFKKLNDKLGHQAGDIALKNVAALMKGEKRTEDIVARYGGEEMVMILPQTGKF
ncbi:MAG: diguanylate cyclase, partial [Nitrospinae bacterium]|nr:diguanylate cyclase [Nitrospinota bacterium]